MPVLKPLLNKIFLILFACIFAQGKLKAQNAYYDAVKINESIRKADTNSAFIKMLPYFLNEQQQINYALFFRVIDSRLKDAAERYLYGSDAQVGRVCRSADGIRNPSREIKDIDTLCNIFEAAGSLKEKIINDSIRIVVQDIKDANRRFMEEGNSLKSQKAEFDTISEVNNGDRYRELKVQLEMTTNRINSIESSLKSLNKIKERYDSIFSSATAATINSKKLIIVSLRNLSNATHFNTLLSTADLVTLETDASKIKDLEFYKETREQQEVIKEKAAVSNESTTLTNFKMPTQSELIDALAIYIARRFKQEVAITLIAELRKEMNKKPLLTELFPETLKLFNSSEDFEIPRFGKMWNHAISEDFVKLPDNISNSKYIQEFVTKYRTENEYLLFKDVVKISNQVIRKNSLPEIIALYKADTSSIKSTAFKQSLEVLNIINNELYDSTTSSQFWISWNSIQKMTTAEYGFFLNLIEARYEPVFSFFKMKKPSEWIGSLASKKPHFKNYLTKGLLVLNNLQKTQKQYQERLEKDPNAAYTGMSFWDYQESLFSIMMDTAIINLPGKADTLLALLKKGAVIYKLLEEKNYAAMVHESMEVLGYVLPTTKNRFNELLVKSWKLDKRKFENISTAFLKQIDSLQDVLQRDLEILSDKYKRLSLSADKESLLRSIDTISSYVLYRDLVRPYRHLLAVKDSVDFKRMLKQVIQGGHVNALAVPDVSKSRFLYITKSAEFFTDIMSASDSKQLANVMEAYSMPSNSYKIKRSSRHAIDLNAYVGAYAGAERIKKRDDSTNYVSKEIGGLYGISVPVGITYSWGTRNETSKPAATSFMNKKGVIKDLTGNSFSLSLTIIDIAAVVAYRLEKGEDIALPKEVKWAQILSPGLHARWGIRNTPLNISTGIQYTPQLRNFKQEASLQQAWRLYTGLFFDLPLYNLYRR